MNYNSYCNMASEIVFPCLIKTCDYLDGVLFDLTRVHALQDISSNLLREKIKTDNMDLIITATHHYLFTITNNDYNLADSIQYLKQFTKEPSAKNVFTKLEQNWQSLYIKESSLYRKKMEFVGYAIDCYKTIRAATEICKPLDDNRNENTAKVFGWFAARAVTFFPTCL